MEREVRCSLGSCCIAGFQAPAPELCDLMSGLSLSVNLILLHLKKNKSHARSPKIAKIQEPGTHEKPT